jgi:ribosomal protein S18 acetylase RimI-like enzyme
MEDEMEARRSQVGSLEIMFKKAVENDIPELTEVMTRAFDDDTRRFGGNPAGGGPPGYNTGDFLRKWMGPGTCYRMMKGDKVVGGFIVFINKDGNNVLRSIWVDPQYQNLGIGAEAIHFIEKTYPDARKWSLGTPEWSTRNHHFYEKCGYKKVGEEYNEEEDFTGFRYDKATES